MFVDQVKVKMIAGKGGNGIVAWRREKFLPKGGPYGGNGGRGANVIIQAEGSIYSLEGFRRKRILRAQNGMPGGVNLRQGKSGAHLIIKVPFGTLVKDSETGEILHDFTPEDSKWIACEGGKGGKGNNFFKTSTNRAPNRCTEGTLGQEKEFELELKLIADVGLVGMPNAGKSTLMTKITHAHVKIGAYPFTTLTPNLSYIQCEDYTRILVADIPGILENAHKNKGLGLEFLKHIERTSSLIFVVDVFPEEEERTALNDFNILRKELEAYNPSMLEKTFAVALNKCDKPGAEEKIAAFKKDYPFDPSTLFVISAKEEEGLSSLIESMRRSKTSTREYETAQ
ncbi:MAG: GTPase ObgE [Simkaniaceae bacterium]|nr:GTPase ObgE [Candidatus Sacchlamyda saccharinae]